MNLTNKNVLITGGTGFLGRPLVRELFGRGANVSVVSRNEGNLVSLKEEFPDVKIILGDISHNHYLDVALAGIDGVFHLAAMKSIGLAETNVYQCCQSNIVGTINLLDHTKDCEFVLGISTDKAAKISGVYGASKYIMEKLFLEYSGMNPTTKYRIVRYGNVLYSTGSVLCKWRDKIQNGDDIIVTDFDATRFFWTVDQAIELIFSCLANATDPTPYIPTMKSSSLRTLLSAMIRKYNADYDFDKIRVIGLQPGENMHETMDGKVFSDEIDRYTVDELLALV